MMITAAAINRYGLLPDSEFCITGRHYYSYARLYCAVNPTGMFHVIFDFRFRKSTMHCDSLITRYESGLQSITSYCYEYHHQVVFLPIHCMRKDGLP